MKKNIKIAAFAGLLSMSFIAQAADVNSIIRLPRVATADSQANQATSIIYIPSCRSKKTC